VSLCVDPRGGAARRAVSTPSNVRARHGQQWDGGHNLWGNAKVTQQGNAAPKSEPEAAAFWRGREAAGRTRRDAKRVGRERHEERLDAEGVGGDEDLALGEIEDGDGELPLKVPCKARAPFLIRLSMRAGERSSARGTMSSAEVMYSAHIALLR